MIGAILKIPGVAKIGAILAAVAGVLMSLFLFGRSKKKEGRREAEAEQKEKVIEAFKDKSKLDSELVSDDARGELRDKHYRD